MDELNMDPLIKALLEGDAKVAASEAKVLVDSGVSIERIVKDGVESAMGTLDAKCTLEQFNLLEIMLVGRAVTETMKQLFPMGADPATTKGTVVLATLEGDVHDLGKNILKMVLTGNGYRVVDCGKDCPLDRLLDTVEREEPVAVAVSGLIATVVPEVRRVKERLSDRGLGHIRVVAGGAVLKQSSSERLNVDYVAESAFDGARYISAIPKEAKT